MAIEGSNPSNPDAADNACSSACEGEAAQARSAYRRSGGGQNTQSSNPIGRGGYRIAATNATGSLSIGSLFYVEFWIF